MKFNYYVVLVVVIICLQRVSDGAVFGGLGIAGGIMAAGAAYHWGRCQFKECCTEKWIHGRKKKKTAFVNELKTHLFGQHLVMQTVPNAIYNHIKDDKPQKALVMSFHGRTGAGKNHVARLITNFIYTEGEESTFAHIRIASEHYPCPDPRDNPDDNRKQIEQYKAQLRNLIKAETIKCGRSLFIFDEADKMPNGLTDVLKPYLDYYPKVEGVDYRKNIFIFLNNIGGDEISDIALANFRKGHKRQKIKTSEMEEILSLASLKKLGGLKDSTIIKSGLVDFFIPFLPLERQHLKLCAAVDIKRRYSDENSETRRLNDTELEDIVKMAVNEIQYYPEKEDIFALTGCKHVTKKVDMFL